MTRAAKENEMTGYLPYDAHLARLEDLHARAATQRRARLAVAPVAAAEPDSADAIAIRCATEADREVLQRLATLDSVVARPGEMLIALVGDEPRAAIHVASGETIADPFRPTAELVELLRLRAERLRDPTTAPAARGLRLRARLRSVHRAA
jgi:hypothetical protein